MCLLLEASISDSSGDDLLDFQRRGGESGPDQIRDILSVPPAPGARLNMTQLVLVAKAYQALLVHY
jgi:hypothetical protein